MKIMKFKTDINGEADLAKIKPIFDNDNEISNWNLDTDGGENTLSISGENINPQQIENKLKDLGFTSEIIRVVGLSGSEL